MSRFLTELRPSSASSTSARANFYREEFLKHQRCLEEQREDHSHHAITEVETALARILSQLEQLCTKDDADEVVGLLLQKFDVVTGLSAWSDQQHVH